ncbi:MAG: hypothetical protein N3A38_14835 [Planctomycetota bacterium]|nr:hypothetical protein [Planctomycetota bacterium]
MSQQDNEKAEGKIPGKEGSPEDQGEPSSGKPGAAINRPGIPASRPVAPAPGQAYKPGRSAIYMPKLTSQPEPPSPGPGFRRFGAFGGVSGAGGAPPAAPGTSPAAFPKQGQTEAAPASGARPFGAPRYQLPRERPANLPPPPKPWAPKAPVAQQAAGPAQLPGAEAVQPEDAPPPARETDAEDEATGDNVPPSDTPPDRKS